MNLSDPTTFLEIQTDGTVQVQTMPIWETEGFQTKILVGLGVILVTAVVATIALAIPGANCVVVSICVGAAKGAVAGALQGFAFGFVQEGISSVLTGITTGEWKYNWNSALGKAADGFMSGAITGAIMGGISGGLNPQYCFEAGTPVATAAGPVAIENVAVGDQVWSYDYLSGESALKTVTGTSVRQTNELVKITADGETVVTTPRHPFYVVDNKEYNGYTAAKFLSVGDRILTSNGSAATVSFIESVETDEPVTVYNLSVEDNHSYYVGENELLVHNNGCGSNVVNKTNVADERANGVFAQLQNNSDDLLRAAQARDVHFDSHLFSSLNRVDGTNIMHDTKFLSDNIDDIFDTVNKVVNNNVATLTKASSHRLVYEFYNVGTIGSETLVNNAGTIMASNLRVVVEINNVGEITRLVTAFPFV